MSFLNTYIHRAKTDNEHLFQNDYNAALKSDKFSSFT